MSTSTKPVRVTKKSKMLAFVTNINDTENRPVTFTEIQGFIVDLDSGPGTYAAARLKYGASKNPYRGSWCSAFHAPYGAYFLSGKEYLIKVKGGYITSLTTTTSLN